MRQMALGRAAQRYDHGSTAKDLFYFLVRASRGSLEFPLFTDYSQSNEDNAEAVSPPRHTVVSDGVLAIIAGSDTTSSVICNAIWAILQRPDVYQRLQAEVDKFYPPGEDSLDGKRIYDMHYLEAVM